MKKLLALFLASLLALSIASCGTEQPESNDTDNSSNGTEDIGDDTTPVVEDTYDTYLCTLDNGMTIEIGGAADDTIAKLGEHIDYMEAPSCVHEGSDKVYTYDGYTVTTSPAADGSEYVAELSLTSDVVALENGLMIGSMLSDMTNALGEDYEESFGVYKYSIEGAIISVLLDGDMVSAITVSSTRS